MNKLKKFLIVSAAVLTVGGVGSASFAGSASANNNGDDWNRQGKHKKDNAPNDPWKVFHFLQKNIEEVKKGGPLLHEHTSLVVPLLKAQSEGSADLAAVTAAVDANSVQVAETVDKLYPGSKDQFLDLWRKHINAYTDYLNAAKANDQAGKDAAKQKLEDFSNDAPTLLDTISDRLYRAGLTEKLKEHTTETLATIDAMVAGDWATVYAKAHMSYEKMTVISVELLLGAKLK
ncbi:MAG TPA: hypothetical protein VJM32_02880 [Candidatus Saccharimonadales bacterium]|nr:hypothetical protein [Candidatus Saccharimonadales bacterium]